ncbi:hypothetical protein [Mycolicibacterium litorale]|uniref:Secreted protein n=1 Tax=Mycolicibacterium litorale TaxID=758802 RepID=A0AAD1IGV7_9MYCO|nr:hypothetical protein [Mycolicibacterium litorale]MCV7414514.1 hypothetical protein [Mycolicibacterium litorale]TDY01500.1 hypothetical protein BCL50_4981 [Mycolicibacterium litorale]BBY15287.1 hypothetical protein MLIT_08790 [Mycolicibacterium litorale]
MTTLTRVIAAAVLALGAAVGAAGPAQAEQQILEGVYTYTQADGLRGEVTIFPSCVPTVGDLREPLYLPVACRLWVQAFTGVQGGQARVTNGVWTYTTAVKDGLKCPDGSLGPIVETYEINTDTMSGTRTTTNVPACNGAMPANMIKTPFTLAYVRPLDTPVDRYPLICEPGGLRRCF